MNRWILLVLLCSWSLSGSDVAGSAISIRSDGCGPHPLIALLAASRFGSDGGPPTTLNKILRAVRADPDVWSQVQALLRRYDDCIRAGDGLHYKRASLNDYTPDDTPF